MTQKRSDTLRLTAKWYMRHKFKFKPPKPKYWEDGKSDPEVASLLLGGAENKRGAAFITSGWFSINTVGCRDTCRSGWLSEKEVAVQCWWCDTDRADEKAERHTGRGGQAETLEGLSAACLEQHISLQQPLRTTICASECFPQAFAAPHAGKPVYYICMSVNNVKQMYKGRTGLNTEEKVALFWYVFYLNSDKGFRVPVAAQEDSAVLGVNEIPGLLDDSCLLMDGWKRVANAADLSALSGSSQMRHSLWLVKHVVRKQNYSV